MDGSLDVMVDVPSWSAWLAHDGYIRAGPLRAQERAYCGLKERAHCGQKERAYSW